MVKNKDIPVVVNGDEELRSLAAAATQRVVSKRKLQILGTNLDQKTSETHAPGLFSIDVKPGTSSDELFSNNLISNAEDVDDAEEIQTPMAKNKFQIHAARIIAERSKESLLMDRSKACVTNIMKYCSTEEGKMLRSILYFPGANKKKPKPKVDLKASGTQQPVGDPLEMGDQLPKPEAKESRKQKKFRNKEAREAKKAGMPALEMTDEYKRDLELLSMRRALDPKRFYKNNDRKMLPKFFQRGVVVDTAADLYSRVPKKQRKRTLADELIHDDGFMSFTKRKFGETAPGPSEKKRKPRQKSKKT